MDSTAMKTAIRNACWECQQGDNYPAPQWRIGNCERDSCSLFLVRPYQHQHLKPIPAVLLREAEAEGKDWMYGE